MARKKVNKIEKFIKDNKLDFTGSGSDLNGNCVILAGYACYLGLSEEDLLASILPLDILDRGMELVRVFNYAYKNNYGEYWKTSDAKKTYAF